MPITETRLQYSTFCCLIEESNFSLFCKIFTNATLKFSTRWFFKGMSFYGHEFFTTDSDSCFRVIFISGSENHKSHDNFYSIFSISIEFFLRFWGGAFLKFLENCNKETAWWDLFFYAVGIRRLDFFWVVFIN